MPGPEATVERKVCKAALALGVPNAKLTVGQGWPDRLFILPNGCSLFIEFKRPGYRPTKLQLYVHQILKELGHEVHVCTVYEEAIAIIRQAVDAAKHPEAGPEVSGGAWSRSAALRPWSRQD